MTKTYDPKCHALALAFLSDFPLLTAEHRARHAHAMACDIQDAIEGYLNGAGCEHPPSEPSGVARTEFAPDVPGMGGGPSKY